MRSGTEKSLAESNSLAQVQDFSACRHKFNALCSFVEKTCGVETKNKRMGKVLITSSVERYTGTRKVSRYPAFKNGPVLRFIITGSLSASCIS